MDYQKLIDFIKKELNVTEYMKNMIGEFIYIDENSSNVINNKIKNYSDILSILTRFQHSEDTGNAGEQP